MLGPLEDETPVSQDFGGCDLLQLVDMRRGMRAQSTPIIEHQGLSAPGRIPVVFGVEVEDMRTDLAAGIRMRGNRGAVGCVVPMHRQDETLMRLQTKHLP